MQCHEARRLLDLGMNPNPADALSASLGFHLAGCPNCRTHRSRRADLQLLVGLLAETPRPPRPKGKPRRSLRPASQAMRLASAAMLAGFALAMAPAAQPKAAIAAQAPAVPKLASSVLVQRSTRLHARQALALKQARLEAADQLLAARRSDEAVLTALLAAPVEAPAAVVEAAPAAAPPLEVAVAAPAAAPPLTELEILQQQTGGLYTVVSGDYLWALATRFYGDPLLWTGIYRRNQEVIGGDPNLIYPGQVFFIPNIDEARRLAGLGPVPVPPVPGPAPVPARGTYVVQPGDTLWDISARTYGSGIYWQSIYGRNTGSIADPNLIYPGQVISIP